VYDVLGGAISFVGTKHRLPRSSQSLHTFFLKASNRLSSDRQFVMLSASRLLMFLWQASTSRVAMVCNCFSSPRFTIFLPRASKSADGWISISKTYVSKKSSNGSQMSRPISVDERALIKICISECQSVRPSLDHRFLMKRSRTARAYSCTTLTVGSISQESCSNRKRSWLGLAWLKIACKSNVSEADFFACW
jgi:hypothetical protein